MLRAHQSKMIEQIKINTISINLKQLDILLKIFLAVKLL